MNLARNNGKRKGMPTGEELSVAAGKTLVISIVPCGHFPKFKVLKP
jgi:hypothetical protein